jgi:hypothetical protein
MSSVGSADHHRSVEQLRADYDRALQAAGGDEGPVYRKFGKDQFRQSDKPYAFLQDSDTATRVRDFDGDYVDAEGREYLEKTDGTIEIRTRARELPPQGDRFIVQPTRKNLRARWLTVTYVDIKDGRGTGTVDGHFSDDDDLPTRRHRQPRRKGHGATTKTRRARVQRAADQ